MLKTNVAAPALLAALFLPLLEKGTKKTIVNVSSAMGSLAHCQGNAMSMYCVSKAACAKFSEGLMSEMGPFGVKVIEINPWFYKTPMLNAEGILRYLRNAWDSADDEVRSAYGGEPYFDQVSKSCAFTVTDKRNVCQDPSEVVNAMIDAVTSFEPDTVYRLIPTGFGIVFWIINDFLPWDIMIHARRLIDSLPLYVPAHKKREKNKTL